MIRTPNLANLLCKPINSLTNFANKILFLIFLYTLILLFKWFNTSLTSHDVCPLAMYLFNFFRRTRRLRLCSIWRPTLRRLFFFYDEQNCWWLQFSPSWSDLIEYIISGPIHLLLISLIVLLTMLLATKDVINSLETPVLSKPFFISSLVHELSPLRCSCFVLSVEHGQDVGG